MYTTHNAKQKQENLSGGTVLVLSFACCLILANLYYVQPILMDIAGTIGLDIAASGIIVTMIQIGYALGILFLVPLGDVLENRRLIPIMILGASGALLAAAWSGNAAMFLVASLFVGLFSAAMQVIIPFAIGLASPTERGRTLGLLMAGAILGMVLARPVAAMATSAVGWRPVYIVAAVLMLALGTALFRLLPQKIPLVRGIGYPAMLRSMGKLLVTVPRLPLRLMIAAVVFLGFSMFWATAPIVLRESLHFSHSQVALFTLAGLITPPCAIVVGRLIDRGYSHILIFTGVSMVATAFLLTIWLGMYAAAFVFTVFMLDPGMNMTTVAVQQKVISAVPEAGSRLNALSAATSFGGGAIGSAFGPWVYSHYGWQTVAVIGAALMVFPFFLNLMVNRGERYAPSTT